GQLCRYQESAEICHFVIFQWRDAADGSTVLIALFARKVSRRLIVISFDPYEMVKDDDLFEYDFFAWAVSAAERFEYYVNSIAVHLFALRAYIHNMSNYILGTETVNLARSGSARSRTKV
ncbi:MAG: hypothetical protein ACLPIC_12265, partial [Rhodoblastus sp.]|uniref:hypothetical protein n=1 Tax=Rhodoblastus sp. TaxID=1962975 RepID=UPI003F99CE86